ncbi:VOC family protein [Xanthobacter sp. KR7-65]|uniref:VOC family protein n=1 Tax=Xanthobacter sp. KR7-65 TaxID=3156612 RepID=UPI0032B47A73
MITIEQLRYVRLGTRDLPAAADFATRILGLQLVERTPQQATFRSDFRDHTLVYVAGDPSEQAVGFELRDEDAFQAALAALAERGIQATPGTAEEAALRKVKAFAAVRDPSGNRIELVLRPMQSGWRFHPTRDSGVTGLEAVALRGTAGEADGDFWTRLLGGRVSDWVGDAAYIRFDGGAHHRLAVHPAATAGVLAVEYRVEGVNQLMQNKYFLQASQVRIVHGPGRRPTSEQMFLTFAGPDGVLFSYVTEGEGAIDEARHRPRQFPRERGSFCSWGSESAIPEFA